MEAPGQNPTEDTLQNLTRLSQKPGVQSTLILSRETGAIVRASGLLTTPTTSNNSLDSNSSSDSKLSTTADEANQKPTGSRPNTSNGANTTSPHTPKQETTTNGINTHNATLKAEDVSKAVMSFFSSAGGLAGTMNTSLIAEDGEGEAEEKGGDEVRLLRLRMRKREIVVVPDERFLLVVVHEVKSGSAGG